MRPQFIQTDFRLQLQRELSGAMNAGEARAVLLLLFEELCGLSTADVLTGKADCLPEPAKDSMRSAVSRVVDGEPVQYVIGNTQFHGLDLTINPSVLIPRPETEELVGLIVSEQRQLDEGVILDVGTGSGCIALALKHELPAVSVMGWDISGAALDVARQNAVRNGLEVTFCQQDIFQARPESGAFDAVVSNPPYICWQEASGMERQVLDHEPHTALFVPDDQPLLFYEAISRFSHVAVKPGGALYFEVNRAYASQVADCMRTFGFADVAVFDDQYGNPRMVRGFRLAL